MDAAFFKSSSHVEECPADGLPEFAFIGRSNVGKSSLINALVERKGLAKTSSKPGKTKLINHFQIEKKWYLVDLPGYGYAGVSKAERANWKTMIETYIRNRRELICLFVLIDSRIPPQRIDLEFIDHLGLWEAPFEIIFTKADKVKKTQRMGLLNNYQKQLAEKWAVLPEFRFTSSQSKMGIQEFREYLGQMINRL